MNLLARAKLSARLIFNSPSSTQRLFYRHPITALQLCDFYSTKATSTIQKTQKLSKPRTQKSPEKSFSFAQTISKQSEAPTAVWPKPQPIPYQERVANIVNLIGNVNIPVKSVNYSDGRYLTAIVISVGNEEGSLSIPVVFEGDLAHVVASHVKVNDCVFVSGQLSVDPLRPVMSESVGKFHVVAENINFVVGFEKSGLDRKLGISSPDVEIDELGKFRSKNVEEKLESSSIERPAVTLYGAETLPQSVAVDQGKVVSSPQNVSNKSWKKDSNEILDLWSDLVKNPLQWWDYRGHKANGLVKEKFPDFKQKGTGESLWISSAPKWILPELRRLEFAVKEMTTKNVFGGEGHSDRKQNSFPETFLKNLVEKGHSEGKQNSDPEDSWKNLVGNPEKWWDNRARKPSPKSPDFRHKETGEGLWLNRSPDWVLSKLPPVRGGQSTA